MPNRPAFSPDWREGRYFDRWMFVHVASGVAGGFSNVFFGLSVPKTVLVGALVMTLWEVGESIAGVNEAFSNRALDVVAGLIGLAVALAVASRLSPAGEHIAFAVSLALASASSFEGWLDYRRRKRERP
ncbi:MAG TPA: hypothetical protein PK788_11315 [Gemmatimonadaceae bacterium]|nr:hypothetical protein [Gemmatimonadaceae bacterium]HRQ79023.1 hypothetical protein [Gemmatimonadaceae bacterium]